MPYQPQPSDVLVHLWHGANRTWNGFPEVQPCRKGAYEHGPGLYLTTHLETAQKYAKGGGSLIAMSLLNPRLLDQQTVPLAEALEFVTTCPGLRHRAKMVEDLRRSETRRNDAHVTLNNVVTLCVNNEALGAGSGPALAAWMVAHGVDGQVVSQKAGQENWLVLYNPAIIVEHRWVPSRTVDASSADHPVIETQLENGRRRAERAVLVDLAERSVEQGEHGLALRARARL